MMPKLPQPKGSWGSQVDQMAKPPKLLTGFSPSRANMPIAASYSFGTTTQASGNNTANYMGPAPWAPLLRDPESRTATSQAASFFSPGPAVVQSPMQPSSIFRNGKDAKDSGAAKVHVYPKAQMHDASHLLSSDKVLKDTAHTIEWLLHESSKAREVSPNDDGTAQLMAESVCCTRMKDVCENKVGS
jgi:hypothetical protein